MAKNAFGLLFLILTMGLSAGSYENNTSNYCQNVMSLFKPLRVAQQIQAHKKSLLEGYRLPLRYMQGYYIRRIEPYLSKPTYSTVENPDVLYRGVFISIDELTELLVHGHEVSKVQWTAVGGQGISLSSSIEEAKTYIFHSADNRPDGLGVLFKFKKTNYMTLVADPQTNPTNTIFKSYQDIPSRDVVGVSLWGEYGFENIQEILIKVEAKQIVPNSIWTSKFDKSPF